MFRRAFPWFVLLSAASTMAAQNFRLGVDFSQPIGNGSLFATSVSGRDGCAGRHLRAG